MPFLMCACATIVFVLVIDGFLKLVLRESLDLVMINTEPLDTDYLTRFYSWDITLYVSYRGCVF